MDPSKKDALLHVPTAVLSLLESMGMVFFFQAEAGIRGGRVTGVQTCALPIWSARSRTAPGRHASARPLRASLPTPRTARSEEHRLNSSHPSISYAVFCLKKKTKYAVFGLSGPKKTRLRSATFTT